MLLHPPLQCNPIWKQDGLVQRGHLELDSIAPKERDPEHVGHLISKACKCKEYNSRNSPDESIVRGQVFSIYSDGAVDSRFLPADGALFASLQSSTADCQAWRLRWMRYLRNLLEAAPPCPDSLVATAVLLLVPAMYYDRGTISEGLDKDWDSPDRCANV